MCDKRESNDVPNYILNSFKSDSHCSEIVQIDRNKESKALCRNAAKQSPALNLFEPNSPPTHNLNRIGEPIFVCSPKIGFDFKDPCMKETPQLEYNALHDPNLKEFFLSQPCTLMHLLKHGLINDKGKVTCNSSDFCKYKRHINRIQNYKNGKCSTNYAKQEKSPRSQIIAEPIAQKSTEAIFQNKNQNKDEIKSLMKEVNEAESSLSKKRALLKKMEDAELFKNLRHMQMYFKEGERLRNKVSQQIESQKYQLHFNNAFCSCNQRLESIQEQEKLRILTKATQQLDHYKFCFESTLLRKKATRGNQNYCDSIREKVKKIDGRKMKCGLLNCPGGPHPINGSMPMEAKKKRLRNVSASPRLTKAKKLPMKENVNKKINNKSKIKTHPIKSKRLRPRTVPQGRSFKKSHYKPILLQNEPTRHNTLQEKSKIRKPRRNKPLSMYKAPANSAVSKSTVSIFSEFSDNPSTFINVSTQESDFSLEEPGLSVVGKSVSEKSMQTNIGESDRDQSTDTLFRKSGQPTEMSARTTMTDVRKSRENYSMTPELMNSVASDAFVKTKEMSTGENSTEINLRKESKSTSSRAPSVSTNETSPKELSYSSVGNDAISELQHGVKSKSTVFDLITKREQSTSPSLQQSSKSTELEPKEVKRKSTITDFAENKENSTSPNKSSFSIASNDPISEIQQMVIDKSTDPDLTPTLDQSTHHHVSSSKSSRATEPEPEKLLSEKSISTDTREVKDNSSSPELLNTRYSVANDPVLEIRQEVKNTSTGPEFTDKRDQSTFSDAPSKSDRSTEHKLQELKGKSTTTDIDQSIKENSTSPPDKSSTSIASGPISEIQQVLKNSSTDPNLSMTQEQSASLPISSHSSKSTEPVVELQPNVSEKLTNTDIRPSQNNSVSPLLELSRSSTANDPIFETQQTLTDKSTDPNIIAKREQSTSLEPSANKSTEPKMNELKEQSTTSNLRASQDQSTSPLLAQSHSKASNPVDEIQKRLSGKSTSMDVGKMQNQSTSPLLLPSNSTGISTQVEDELPAIFSKSSTTDAKEINDQITSISNSLSVASGSDLESLKNNLSTSKSIMTDQGQNKSIVFLPKSHTTASKITQKEDSPESLLRSEVNSQTFSTQTTTVANITSDVVLHSNTSQMPEIQTRMAVKSTVTDFGNINHQSTPNITTEIIEIDASDVEQWKSIFLEPSNLDYLVLDGDEFEIEIENHYDIIIESDEETVLDASTAHSIELKESVQSSLESIDDYSNFFSPNNRVNELLSYLSSDTLNTAPSSERSIQSRASNVPEITVTRPSRDPIPVSCGETTSSSKLKVPKVNTEVPTRMPERVKSSRHSNCIDQELMAILDTILEEQKIKLQSERDNLASSDEENIRMRTMRSVDRIASEMVNVTLCKKVYILQVKRKKSSLKNPNLTLNMMPPEQVEIREPDAETSESRGSYNVAPAPSGTIELIPPRDVSQSVMNFKVEPIEFVKEHVVPIESDTSATAGLHVHLGEVASHIHTLADSEITPSVAQFDKEATSDVTRQSQTSNPEQSQNVLITPSLLATTPPQDLKKIIFEQLGSIRQEVNSLRHELQVLRERRASNRTSQSQPTSQIPENHRKE